MSDSNNSKPDDVTEKIEIFSTDDEKIKSIGELLSNDASREILQLLFKKELTANQIAQETEVSLQLVKYHLNKMQDMGIVKVSKIGKNVKAQDMKYYKATKFAVVVVPSAVSDRAKESKLLVRSFKTIYRFTAIVVAGIAAWFTSSSFQPAHFSAGPSANQKTTTPPPSAGSPGSMLEGEGAYTLEESLELAKRRIEGSEASPAAGSGTPVLGGEDLFWPIIITIAVVGAGLILEVIFRLYLRTRKKQKEATKV